jgi:hypothetical protein
VVSDGQGNWDASPNWDTVGEAQKGGIEGVIAKEHEAQMGGASMACMHWEDVSVPVTGTVSGEGRASVGAGAAADVL